MKTQETIEEAAERLCPSDGYFDEIYCDIGEYDRKKWIEGAKYQQDRMYSEEEVKPLLDAIEYFINRVENGTIRSKTTYKMYKELLEQFKKK